MRNVLTANNLAIGVTCLVIGYSAATVLTFWHSDTWPEFFGTLTAASVAAIALIFGHYYQDRLARNRDREALTKARHAEAVDLCFWLRHCDYELEFIETALIRIQDKLKSDGKSSLAVSTETFRQIVTPNFHSDLLDRAKAASKLTPEISGLISADLYKTFTVADRIFLLKQAARDYQPTVEAIEKYIFVLGRRRAVLRDDAKLIEEYLIGKGALPRFPEE
jgi:hypothetical protein